MELQHGDRCARRSHRSRVWPAARPIPRAQHLRATWHARNGLPRHALDGRPNPGALFTRPGREPPAERGAAVGWLFAVRTTLQRRWWPAFDTSGLFAFRTDASQRRGARRPTYRQSGKRRGLMRNHLPAKLTPIHSPMVGHEGYRYGLGGGARRLFGGWIAGLSGDLPMVGFDGDVLLDRSEIGFDRNGVDAVQYRARLSDRAGFSATRVRRRSAVAKGTGTENGGNVSRPMGHWASAMRFSRTTRRGVGSPRRRGRQAAFDEARNRVVIFGGDDDGRLLWDGETWTDVADSSCSMAPHTAESPWPGTIRMVHLFHWRHAPLGEAHLC